MNRARGRANLRYGLWQDTPDGPLPAENHPPPVDGGTPFTRHCTACGAAPRQPCTRPSRGGRKNLRSYHPTRCQPPQEPPNEPQKKLPQT